MESQRKFPGGHSSPWSGESWAWNNPQIIVGDNNNSMTCFLRRDEITNVAVLDDFGFTVPDNARITGFIVHMEKMQSSTESTPMFKDYSVQLTTSSQIKAKTQFYPVNEFEWLELGDANDLWGLSVSPSNVNSPAFSVRYRCIKTAGPTLSQNQCRVRRLQLEVFYEVPKAGMEIWNGSAWVRHPAKVWNGSAWVGHPVRFWNGSQWVMVE